MSWQAALGTRKCTDMQWSVVWNDEWIAGLSAKHLDQVAEHEREHLSYMELAPSERAMHLAAICRLQQRLPCLEPNGGINTCGVVRRSY